LSDASLISAVVIAIVAYMYFTIIRPARNDQKRQRQEMRDLKPGDRVLTTSNFIATVREIQVRADGQTRVFLEIAEGVVVTALPGAIIERVRPDVSATTGETQSTSPASDNPASKQKGASA
jgi:preprotein translocase YajC subunit